MMKCQGVMSSIKISLPKPYDRSILVIRVGLSQALISAKMGHKQIKERNHGCDFALGADRLWLSRDQS
ncbi:MAG: hypothetical protein COV08_03320 [Candidatus Vogelbacteria bacterium CG10_big_fil_rev_8_21_14_0_10_49_38]|uniref:Uncharacterized protein n=1 Tax=Candidatus Vogelbacteria bacterium CG10_big_fil_rev_8_21_14_0_10_49_38 TaxID=1975043 RepID=A0A2H0RJ16_9BACT|nr:MAG: hypothetical protein COV08_03320 [Candidatus Vogelbacteria bacterium CG10_big_fil_rev_8_21_14_0_10_49_38]